MTCDSWGMLAQRAADLQLLPRYAQRPLGPPPHAVAKPPPPKRAALQGMRQGTMPQLRLLPRQRVCPSLHILTRGLPVAPGAPPAPHRCGAVRLRLVVSCGAA